MIVSRWKVPCIFQVVSVSQISVMYKQAERVKNPAHCLNDLYNKIRRIEQRPTMQLQCLLMLLPATYTGHILKLNA
jgi:hypothetical protein